MADLFADNLPTPPTLDGCMTRGDGAAWAVFSECGKYRYLLSRMWDPYLPTMVFGMMNPSIAGHDQTDPTLTKCLGFARRHGCGGVIVANCGAYIATDPNEWARAADPIGPMNEAAIRLAFRGPMMSKRVAAWGRMPNRRVYERAKGMMAWMKCNGATWCFGTTKDGEPRHPLMLAYDTPLVSLEGYSRERG